MPRYHVGSGIFGIYAGTLNKRGDMWLNKSDVTEEALSCVAVYLLDNEKRYIFEYRGKMYQLNVTSFNEKEVKEHENK